MRAANCILIRPRPRCRSTLSLTFTGLGFLKKRTTISNGRAKSNTKITKQINIARAAKRRFARALNCISELSLKATSIQIPFWGWYLNGYRPGLAVIRAQLLIAKTSSTLLDNADKSKQQAAKHVSTSCKQSQWLPKLSKDCPKLPKAAKTCHELPTCCQMLL